MVILGIDPGTAITGWGVVEKKGRKINPVAYGSIQTPAETSMPTRLQTIYDDLCEVIEEFQPQEMAVENLFFFKNAKTVITVGQARGVVLLAGEKNHVSIYEYTPLQIKQTVAGYGRATKGQIQEMITKLLKLTEIPKPDDVADALAAAYTHSVFNQELR